MTSADNSSHSQVMIIFLHFPISFPFSLPFPFINIHDIQFQNPMHQHSPVPLNHSNRLSFFVRAVLLSAVSFTLLIWLCLVKRGKGLQAPWPPLDPHSSLFPSKAKLLTCPPSRANSFYLCGDYSKNKTCHLMVVWDGS